MNDIDQFILESEDGLGFEQIFEVKHNLSFEEACSFLKEKGGCIRHPHMYYDDVEDRGDGWTYTIPLYFCVDKFFMAYLCDSEFTCGAYPEDDAEADLPEYWHDYIGLEAYLSKEWSHGFYVEDKG